MPLTEEARNLPMSEVFVFMEIWKKIKGYQYEVSNTGKVRTIERIVSFGSQKRLIKQKTLKSYKASEKYPIVALCKDAKHKTFRVHRLVALAFIPNKHNKKEVNHIDSDKGNNNFKNLEWSTRKENAKHAKINNLYNSPKGEKCKVSKLKNNQVYEIRNLVSKNDLTIMEIACKFNVGLTTIRNIRDGITWKHLS